MKILDRLGGIARLLDRAGLAENDVIAEFARQFHRQRLGVERVGFGEVLLRCVRHVGVGLGFEFLGETQDFSDEFLFAHRGEDARCLGLIDQRGFGEFLLFDERLGFQENRLVLPTGFREILHQTVSGAHGIGEFFILEQGSGFQKQQFIGSGILCGESLVRNLGGLVILACAHFRLSPCQKGGLGRGVVGCQGEGTECGKLRVHAGGPVFHGAGSFL